MLVAVLVCCAVFATSARADGDPGSDVLVDQNLFSTTLSTAQQEQLGKLLDATASAGAPIRVAVIANRNDLGTVTALWRKPQAYASYLGYEIAPAFSGRVLVVMPNGYGISWHANKAGELKLAELMARYHPTSTTPTGYQAATVAATDLLESKAGVNHATLARAQAKAAAVRQTKVLGWEQPASSVDVLKVSQPSSGGSTNTTVVILLLVLLVLLGAALVIVARRLGMRIRGVNLIAAGLLVAVVAGALIISQTKTTPARASLGDSLATNPYLDPGTALHGVHAPNFTLTDETGHRVSLAQYRGKVVVLSFVDAECQTICPLTTQAMLDAKAALGKAGRNVQLLGVNANWKSLQVDDVLNYTELHGLLGRWHFLTSDSLPQLERVWSAYHVNEKALDHGNGNEIEHIAETFIIGPGGREQYTFTTYPSYAAIGQLGERMAHDIAQLLPNHPAVQMHQSYAAIHGITPADSVSLPRLGSGSVALGPGHPRLYLFFATWDSQTTPIAARLAGEMNGYAADAAREHLPGLTAIDEASVEPSPQALQEFVNRLPVKLRYPVALDASGRVADGYDVEGEPWFVLVDGRGQIVWYQEVYTSGWPNLTSLQQQVKAAIDGGGSSGPLTKGIVAQDLAGSPPPLAALHRQSSHVLPGGLAALQKRIKALRGYTIVVNAWGSWCTACQKEYPLFERASAQFGKRIAFIGADTLETDSQSGAQYLRQHHVSYPSYAIPYLGFQKLVAGGLGGLPDTIYIGPNGRVDGFHRGAYASQGSLDQDIQNAALGG